MTSTTAVTVRPARAADLPMIEALLASEHLPVAGAREHLGDYVVACADDIVGCVGLERYGHAGLLRSLVVAPSFRGKGVGELLARECLDHARRANVQTIVLLTETAERFFERLGFQRIDRIDVPPAVHASVEFQGACPASAVAMRILLIEGGSA